MTTLSIHYSTKFATPYFMAEICQVIVSNNDDSENKKKFWFINFHIDTTS